MITKNTSKEDLVKFLVEKSGEVKVLDNKLYDKISYVYNLYKKDESKVRKRDLFEVAKAVMKCLGTQEPNTEKQAQEEPQPEQPAVENQVKKTLKKGKKAENVQEQQEPQVDNKKSANKTGAKSEKKEASKSAVTPLSKVFSEVIEDEKGNKYKIAHDIQTIEDLYNTLVDNDEQIIMFAMYWNETHLAQFPYFEDRLPYPDKFHNDLDLAECLHVSEQFIVAYAISAYTEAMYMFNPKSFKERKGIRYSNGIEYQIYRLIEDEEDTEETEEEETE